MPGEAPRTRAALAVEGTPRACASASACSRPRRRTDSSSAAAAAASRFSRRFSSSMRSSAPSEKSAHPHMAWLQAYGRHHG